MIYFDGLISGYTVRGNRISGARSGLMVHGGRDTTIVANRFSDVDIAVVVDDGGPDGGWPHDQCPKAMNRGLEFVNATGPPWSAAFPHAKEAGVSSKFQCRCVNTRIQYNQCGPGVGQFIVFSDLAMRNDSSYKAVLSPNIDCPVVGSLGGENKAAPPKTDDVSDDG